MTTYKKIGSVWCSWPNQPIGIIDFIGGSYLAAKPQVTYRRLINELNMEKFAVNALSYLPGLDHQSQAKNAWINFRRCKEIISTRYGLKINAIRIGHSLGCKLHLLSPDGGRNSNGMMAISFNNFTINKSIPMIKNISPKVRINAEFTPSPNETLRLIKNHYIQPNNLLINFEKDELDQSNILLNCFKERPKDNSRIIHLKGNHLTPASTGIRKNIFGETRGDEAKRIFFNRIMSEILKF